MYQKKYNRMKKQVLRKLFAFTIILIVFSRCALSLIDISPDRPNGVFDGGSPKVTGIFYKLNETLQL
jgi:hypothetical protein